MRKIRIKKYLDLTDEALCSMYQKESEPEILEYLLFKYERYIHKVAGLYYNKTNLEDEDILSYAKIGFMEGVLRYDVSRSGYFMFFVAMWMRTKILLAIDDFNRIIKYPVNRLKEYRKVQSLATFSIQDFPDIQDIAIKTGLQEKQVMNYLFSFYSEYDIDLFYNLKSEEKSITEELDKRDLKNDINTVLSKFSEIEKYILNRSFGLNEQPIMDIVDIGKHLNISSERVRQIKNKCIRILRHSSYSAILKQHLN
jgi:RNA polymerase sigma factor (sigma-70 family)